MAPKRCCCKLSCKLDSDNFNRPDSEDDPGDKWEVISGTWGIEDGVLFGEGVLAARKLHNPLLARGSFVSEFKLMNPGSGKTYRVRPGDPSDSTYELTVTLTPGSPTGTVHVELRAGTDTEEWEWDDWVSSSEQISIQFCYAPSLYLTALVMFDGSLRPVEKVDLLIGDGGEPSWIVGEKEVGNFSFLEGDFDDWEYGVNWVDKRDCPYCSCFCYEDKGDGVKYTALPGILTLNIVDIDECPQLEGSFPLFQAELVPKSTEDPTIIVFDRPDKLTWVTPGISCPGMEGWSDDGIIWFQLDCIGIGIATGRPRFALSIIKSQEVYSDQDLRFDQTHPDTETSGAGHPGSRAFATAESTCDPFILEFPGIENRISTANPTSTCCLGPIPVVDPGSEDFESFARVYVTLPADEEEE